MIVVDASAVVEYLLGSPLGQDVREHIAPSSARVATPALLDIEVAQAVRGCYLGGLLEEARANKSIEHLANLNVARWPNAPLLPRVWSLRHNFTAYDAAYVALAESLDATLLTCDAALADNPAAGCNVQLVR